MEHSSSPADQEPEGLRERIKRAHEDAAQAERELAERLKPSTPERDEGKAA